MEHILSGAGERPGDSVIGMIALPGPGRLPTGDFMAKNTFRPGEEHENY